MQIEVLFVTNVRTASHRYPDVVIYEDGPLVRALLDAGHVVLIDPPILSGYNEDEFHGENNIVSEPDPGVDAKLTSSPRNRKTSKQRSTKSKAISTDSDG